MSKRVSLPHSDDEGFVHKLLVENHNKQRDIDKLRNRLSALERVKQRDIEASVRRVIQILVGRFESSRGRGNLSLEVLQHNPPCLLYALGFRVPLPTHQQDQEWQEAWRGWMFGNEVCVNNLMRSHGMPEICLHDMPSVEDTYHTKALMYNSVLPFMTRQWWDELRRWAQLPSWMDSSNKTNCSATS